MSQEDVDWDINPDETPDLSEEKLNEIKTAILEPLLAASKNEGTFFPSKHEDRFRLEIAGKKALGEFSPSYSRNVAIINFSKKFVPIFEERLKNPKDSGILGSIFRTKPATTLEEAKGKFGYSDVQKMIITKLIMLKSELAKEISITDLASPTKLNSFKRLFRDILAGGVATFYNQSAIRQYPRIARIWTGVDSKCNPIIGYTLSFLEKYFNNPPLKQCGGRSRHTRRRPNRRRRNTRRRR